ncbi:MAG: SDR family NAD(P)-dependent oxidoreductase, partial [Actinobacteria bacterium]|nr:SDR family NAD(P)-dependent oxidoreductase [Actinomycetota bacterium]
MRISQIPIPKGMPAPYHRLSNSNHGQSLSVKKPLAEQVIVIAGASSGIGRATARAAGARGAKVVVAARNEEALVAAAAEVEAAGGEALAVVADTTSPADNESLCARAKERFGRIDTFVCSIMVTVYAEVEELDADELR